MKIQNILAGALAIGFASSATAQTYIEITGATAFRQATMQAIYNAYDSVGNLGTEFNVAHDFTGNNLSQLIASNRAIFKGAFPGITGTTIIRTSFNGSTEGLNAIAGNGNPQFFTEASLLNTGDIQGDADVGGSFVTNVRPRFSFSDVFQSTSPVDNEVLQPVGSSAVGVVTFAMIANEGAPSDFTNATMQQCAALWSVGILPLSVFTGDPADTDLVFATGRNDGSGTRSAYLTEWQYGAANLVDQYIATATGANGTITAITRVPANGLGTGNFTTSGATNASTLWGNSAVGNGGYASSSALRSLMGLTSNSTDVYDGENQEPLLEDAKIHLLTWLSTSDSKNASDAGAKILAYNGVQITPIAQAGSYQDSGFNQADFQKIAYGQYSAWSYQHLYHYGTLSSAESTFRTKMTEVGGFIEQGLQATANGLRLSDMQVERADDGFAITNL
jgi:hypothetical protein